MVSDHEQSHFANSADDQLDRQMERLVDQGVLTPYGAAAEVLDFDPHRDNVVVRDPRAAEAAHKRRRHYSSRGGRAFNEGERLFDLLGGSAVILSDEVRASNHTHIENIKAELHADQVDSRQTPEHEQHLEEVRRRADEELRRA